MNKYENIGILVAGAEQAYRIFLFSKKRVNDYARFFVTVKQIASELEKALEELNDKRFDSAKEQVSNILKNGEFVYSLVEEGEKHETI